MKAKSKFDTIVDGVEARMNDEYVDDGRFLLFLNDFEIFCEDDIMSKWAERSVFVGGEFRVDNPLGELLGVSLPEAMSYTTELDGSTGSNWFAFVDEWRELHKSILASVLNLQEAYEDVSGFLKPRVHDIDWDLYSRMVAGVVEMVKKDHGEMIKVGSAKMSDGRTIKPRFKHASQLRKWGGSLANKIGVEGDAMKTDVFIGSALRKYFQYTELVEMLEQMLGKVIGRLDGVDLEEYEEYREERWRKVFNNLRANQINLIEGRHR